MVIPDKVKDKVKLQYRFMSQRLSGNSLKEVNITLRSKADLFNYFFFQEGDSKDKKRE